MQYFLTEGLIYESLAEKIRCQNAVNSLLNQLSYLLQRQCICPGHYLCVCCILSGKSY